MKIHTSISERQVINFIKTYHNVKVFLLETKKLLSHK